MRPHGLQFARLLKEYGCTEIYRPWPERLIMFVGGEPYNLPASVCFKGIEPGKKSMAYALELRADDRTLTDTDSEQVMSKVLKALEKELNAVLR